jgi:internalin A
MKSLRLKLRKNETTLSSKKLEGIDFESVTHLELIAEGLEILPNELFKLQNLVTLEIVAPNLLELHPFIFSLPHLYRLKIKGGFFTELPRHDAKMGHELKELSIVGSKLKALPHWPFMLFKDLELLDLGKNNLSEIPEEIGKLTKLKRLNLEGNTLSKLPAKFYELKNLLHICLDNNPLT